MLYCVILCCSIIFAFELHTHIEIFFYFFHQSFCSTSIKFKRKFNSEPAECAHIYALDKRNGVCVSFFIFFFRGKQEPVNVQLWSPFSLQNEMNTNDNNKKRCVCVCISVYFMILYFVIAQMYCYEFMNFLRRVSKHGHNKNILKQSRKKKTSTNAKCDLLIWFTELNDETKPIYCRYFSEMVRPIQKFRFDLIVIICVYFMRFMSSAYNIRSLIWLIFRTNVIIMIQSNPLLLFGKCVWCHNFY